jgi:flagellar hook assembly protein FlgD
VKQIYAGDHVTINVYTRDGGIVKNLFEGDVTERGTGEIIWDGTKKDGSIVSSGIYILLIKTSYYETTVKISVLR